MKAETLKNKERFAAELSEAKVKAAMEQVLEITERNFDKFRDKFPSHNSENQYYIPEDNFQGGWNNGFWTGIIWLCYEISGKEIFKEVATGQIPSFYKRIDEKIGVNHHDMGFLYSLSCVAAYKLTGNEQAKQAAIMAAEHLITRYNKEGEFIQAWGDVGAENARRLIIDCLLNIPLLYWAAAETGNKEMDEIAYKHYCTTMKVIFREDGSSFHTFFFNSDGTPQKGVTHQGYSDSSCWARGQAWGLYGIPLTNKYHYDETSEERYEAVANFFLNRLPADLVPYWDMIFTDGDDQARDSSAGAIAVCGMLEMIKYIKNDDLKKTYKAAADSIMNSLIDNYAAKTTDATNGLLFHSTYHYKGNVGVDECNIWGDYFYVEALVRYLKKDWELYW